jgi:tetratricopeptide (TPR) repeat protein
LIALLGVTGFMSLILQAFFRDESWSLAGQTLLFLGFVGGTAFIISGVLSPDDRQRLMFTLTPSLGAVVLGLIIPGMLRLFLGIAVGWLFGAQFLLRNRGSQREYKMAIRAMRQGKYDQAIEHITSLIKSEPNTAGHFGFRAQLHRLNGDLKRAESDYRRMMKLEPASGVAPNGLAEIYLQKEDFAEARRWAEVAYEKAPTEWVAMYNLGMIAERQQDDAVAVKYLNEALAVKMPDSRHRLLTYLWLARIYHRQGHQEQAEKMLEGLRREKKGLHEWEIILESQEASSLRGLLQDDVRLAGALMVGKSLAEVFDAAG